jgi:hypothetical protein
MKKRKEWTRGDEENLILLNFIISLSFICVRMKTLIAGVERDATLSHKVSTNTFSLQSNKGQLEQLWTKKNQEN